jgi:hypothetical protein
VTAQAGSTYYWGSSTSPVKYNWHMPGDVDQLPYEPRFIVFYRDLREPWYAVRWTDVALDRVFSYPGRHEMVDLVVALIPREDLSSTVTPTSAPSSSETGDEAPDELPDDEWLLAAPVPQKRIPPTRRRVGRVPRRVAGNLARILATKIEMPPLPSELPGLEE